MSIQKFERILIAGGSGFIGSVMVKLLISHGLRPMVADRNVSEDATDGAFDIARIDLTDGKAVKNLVYDYLPELVINLAGATFRDDPTGEYCNELIFKAAAMLIELASQAGAKKAITMGSAGEYGDNQTPFREDMQQRPVSHYARSKAKATKFALEFAASTGFDVTVLRAFTAYGPGQPSNMFLSQLVRHALLNERFNMSDGTQRRDLVFVKDVADAICAASISERAAGRVINVGTGRAIALREVAEYVWRTCGADADKLCIGAREKSGDDPFDTMADISLAAELLNWRPKTPFESGIGKMIESTRLELEKSS